MLEIIKKHLAALSSSSWDDYRATLANDAAYDEVATGERVVGIDAHIESLQRWKTAFPDLKATVVRGYTVADRVVAEVEWEGTHRGTLEGMFGIVRATHRRCRVKAILLFTVRSGKIVETRHYFDMLTILYQLGVSSSVSAAPPAPRGTEVRP